MKIKSKSIDDYISKLPEDRKLPFSKLRKTIVDNLPPGFEEQILYNMPAWVIPHSIYPDGYHVNPDLPLPFINIASQKNFIALYHVGIYAEPTLLDWFAQEYSNHVKTKLDMGKSCVRFKKIDQIPYDLIGKLATKMTTTDWIKKYESVVKK